MLLCSCARGRWLRSCLRRGARGGVERQLWGGGQNGLFERALARGLGARAEKPGEVFIQTFHPDEFVIRAAADADFIRFADAELRDREAAGLPPYMKFATAMFRARDCASAQRWAELYGNSRELSQSAFDSLAAEYASNPEAGVP